MRSVRALLSFSIFTLPYCPRWHWKWCNCPSMSRSVRATSHLLAAFYGQISRPGKIAKSTVFSVRVLAVCFGVSVLCEWSGGHQLRSRSPHHTVSQRPIFSWNRVVSQISFVYTHCRFFYSIANNCAYLEVSVWHFDTYLHWVVIKTGEPKCQLLWSYAQYDNDPLSLVFASKMPMRLLWSVGIPLFCVTLEPCSFNLILMSYPLY